MVDKYILLLSYYPSVVLVTQSAQIVGQKSTNARPAAKLSLVSENSEVNLLMFIFGIYSVFLYYYHMIISLYIAYNWYPHLIPQVEILEWRPWSGWSEVLKKGPCWHYCILYWHILAYPSTEKAISWIKKRTKMQEVFKICST